MSETAGFSLVRRLTALVAGLGVLAVVFNLLLLPALFGPVLDDYALAQARQAALVRRLLLQTPATAQDLLQHDLATLGIHLGRDEPAQLGEQPLRYPLHVLLQMQALVGPDQALEFAASPVAGPDEPPGFALASRVALPDGQAWWLTLASATPLASPMAAAFTAMGVVGVLVAAVAVLAVRLFTRPMAELATQLLARSDVLRPVQLPRHASRELCQVTDAFNQMVLALQGHEQRRQQLMAGLSHDLRTPLARLRLRTECLLPGNALPPLEADFEVLDRIIGQFVAYTQVGSSDRPAGRLLPLRLVLDRLAVRYEHEPGLVFAPLPPDLPAWPVPDLSVLRVLVNLVDNALEHGQRPVQVSVHCSAPPGAPAAMTLWVHDAGPGVEALAERLTGQRPGRTGSRAGGLGLRISEQIARQLGGSLLVQAHDGQRSGIGLRLPAPG